MKDIKSVVAKNLASLRKSRGMTQEELARKFNYTSKAICRWELGETMPDLNVLGALCEFYGITMNDLVSPEPIVATENLQKRTLRVYRIWLCLLLCFAVWLSATVIFTLTLNSGASPYWIVFVWAVPVNCIVIILCAGRMMHWVAKSVIHSVSLWTACTGLYLHLLTCFAFNCWYLFIVCLPLQGVLILLFGVRRYKGKLTAALADTPQSTPTDIDE